MAEKDRRIIEMQFENRQFEKNIAKSTKSVEDLKRAMDFEKVSNGLKKFGEGFKNIDFSRVTDNIQKLTDKFTGLGTLSELVLSQIRRGIEQTAAKISGFISSMTTAQVSAGMDKYEMLNKSVQTIKAATGREEADVYNVLDRLNKYTDQTSYNFADMAQNIGKFTSVGIGLEDAEKQMEGIANWAARSGAGINEASRAMYNLSQAMGVGKLTLIDWKSIENAGMATKEFKEQLIQAGLAAGTLVNEKGVIKTAKSLGKQVEVNYQTLNSTLQKGWATKGVLSSTLEKYYYEDLDLSEGAVQKAILDLDEKQKKAFDSMIASGKKLTAEEWKTLEGMGVITDDVRQKIVDLAVTNGKLTKEIDKDGKTIYKTVNKTGKKIEFTLEDIGKSLSVGWFDQGFGEAVTSVNELAKSSYEAAKKCLTFSDVLGAWKDQISTGWMQSFKYIFGELSDSMEFFSNVCDRVGEAIGNLIGIRNDALKVWSDDGGRDSLIKLIMGGDGAFGIMDMLEGAGKLVFDGFKDFAMLFGNARDKAAVAAKPEYFATYLGYKLSDAMKSLQGFFNGIRDFFNSEVEYDGKVKTRLEVIGDVVKGIAGALKLGYDLVTKSVEFIGMIGEDLTPGFDSLLQFFGDLGRSIFDTADEVGKENKFRKFFEDLRETVKPLTDSLNTLMIALSDLLYTIFGLGEEGATQTETLKKIGNVIKTVASIITKVATPIINFVSRIVGLIDDLVKEGVNGESLKKFGAGIGNAFGEMMNAFADALPKKLSFLSDWIHGLFGGAKEEAEGQANSLFGLINKVRGKAGAAEKDAQKSDGKSGGAGILGLMTGSNIAVWLGVASLVSVVLLLRKARKVVKEVGNFIGGLGDSLKNGFKVKFQDESWATKFIKLCAGIALVAASILVLGSMPLESLLQGGIAVLAVAGIMFGLFELLKRSNAKSDFKDQMAFSAQVAAMAFAMSALAIAVGILTLALIPFTLMNWDQYGRAMAGLGGILLEMIAFMGLIKVLKVDKASIVGFAGFAIGLGILVQGLLPFANMNWDQYARVMAGLGGILLEILAFMELFKLLGLSTKAMKFDGIIKFTLALAILVFAIRPFANMTWDQYARVMAGLGGVLVEILAFMELFKLLGLSTKALNFKGIIKFTLALAILIFAIQPFANMSWDQYARVMAGLGGVLVEILAFMELFKLLGLSTKALNFDGIIKFVAALAILIFAIQPFANMSWDQYARVMAGLGGVLVEILAFMELFKILGLSTKALHFEGILLFSIGLWILINAIMPFKDLTWEQYAKTMAGLGGVLVAIAGFMELLKLIKSPSLQVAALMGFAYGLSALINAIVPFANMSWDQFTVVMLGLIATLGIMVGFMAIVKKMNPNTGKMLKLAVFATLFAAVAAIFAGVLTIVKDVDWKVIAAFTLGLTVLLVGIGAAAAIANVIGVKGFLILAVGVALVFAALALVLPLLIGSVMGALRDAAGDLTIIADLMETFSSKTDGMNEGSFKKAERMIDSMGDIVRLIASFIFNAGSTREFMTCMAHLVLTADQMIKFDQRIKTMSPDGGVGKASGIIAGFRTIFLEQLADFGSFYNYADAFYSAIYKLGSGFDYFHNMTKDMPNANDNQGLQLIKQLAGCAPDLDIIYKMNLDKFKTQLAELGGALILYAQGAEKVNGGEIKDDTDVSGAITLLHKIAEAFEGEDGFTIPSNMPKDDEITEFGVEIAALAGALVAFEEAGKGLGDGTQNALNALDYFYNLKEKLLAMEGFGSDLTASINSFKGEDGTFIAKDELTTFGEDIAQLGSAMAQFAASTQYTDEKTGEAKAIDFTKATEALESIAGLNEKLPSIGGVKDVILGRQETLKDLSDQITLLGSALGEFFESTTTVNNGIPTQMEFGNATSFLQSIVKMQTDMKDIKIGGLPDFFEGHEMSFGDLASELVQLGSGLNIFSNKIIGKNEKGEQVGETFNTTLASEATKLLETDMVPFMRVLATQLPSVGGLGNIIKTALTGRGFELKDLGNQLTPLGEGLGGLGKGLTDGGWANNLGIENAFAALDSISGILLKLGGIDDLYGASSVVAFTNLIDFMNLMVNGLSDDEAAATGRDHGYPAMAKTLGEFLNAISTEIGKFASTSAELETLHTKLEIFKMFMESLATMTSIDTSKNWSQLGAKLTSELAEAIMTGTDGVKTAVEDMIRIAWNAGDNVEGAKWYDMGINIGLGIKQGVDDASPLYVTPAVEQMMRTAYDAGKKAIDSNSPSKLFAELGKFMGEGTAIGIDDSTKEVGKSASLMGEVALNQARDIVALISTIMAEDISANPTITPILDMSNMEEGMNKFRNSLSGYGVNLDASYSAMAAQGGASQYLENTIPQAPDYSGIYDRMDALGERIGQMETSISKMKLVLDTGVVAGGVANRVDEIIGQKIWLLDRNNSV